MDLKEYFAAQEGFGVLSTADKEGRVNSAVFARPHFFEDQTIGFIMPDRLTHSNLQTNGNATYLFRREPSNDSDRYNGRRLYLEVVGEDDDPDRISRLRRRNYGDDRDGRYLVIFKIEKELPLIGARHQGD